MISLSQIEKNPLYIKYLTNLSLILFKFGKLIALQNLLKNNNRYSR